MMRRVGQQDENLAEIDLTEDEIDAMMAAGRPVDIVGPPVSHNTIWFELFGDAASQYRWRLTSSTGDVLATGDTRYATKKDAVRAVDEIMRAAAHAALVDRTGKAS